MLSAEVPSLGLYVHFPYCLKKCPYCDFLSVAVDRAEIDHAGYADTALWELDLRVEGLAEHKLSSVFFGGGTPSLWEPAELGRVLQAALAQWPGGGEPREVTVECNPSSLDEQRARALRAVGVNRLSIGVQGLDAERLGFLGRLHDPEMGLDAVRAALRAGFERVSADLIFGVAGQTPEQAATEARQIADLGVSHLSAYALTVEPGTQFGALASKRRLPLLDEGEVAHSFEAVSRALEEAGFEHYEVSNYARHGDYAKHNLGYWRGQDYLGIGCGAWGTVTRPQGKLRYRNTQNPDRYLTCDRHTAASQAWEASALTHTIEPISADTSISEAIMLGLRLAEGIDLASLQTRTGVDPWTPTRRATAERLIQRGRIMHEGTRLRIPRNHWLFADGIISELM